MGRFSAREFETSGDAAAQSVPTTSRAEAAAIASACTTQDSDKARAGADLGAIDRLKARVVLDEPFLRNEDATKGVVPDELVGAAHPALPARQDPSR